MKRWLVIGVATLGLLACYSVPTDIAPPSPVPSVTPDLIASPPNDTEPSPIIWLTPPPSPTPLPPTPSPQLGAVLEGTEMGIISGVSVERKKAGFSDLTNDSMLTELARDRSRDMSSRNYFSHTNPDGKNIFDIMDDVGYSYTAAGENIGVTTNPEDTKVALELMGAWMKSAGHKRNILDKSFTRIGVGVYRGSDGKAFATQVFSRPQ